MAVYLDDKKIGQGRMWKSKFWLGQDMSFSKENFAPACDENHYFSIKHNINILLSGLGISVEDFGWEMVRAEEWLGMASARLELAPL